MRVMVLVKAAEDSESGNLPAAELMEAMGRFNDELVSAGIMQTAAGLKPSSQGKRVAFDGTDRKVVEGPSRTLGSWSPALALGGEGHGRGSRLGKTLPQFHARAE